MKAAIYKCPRCDKPFEFHREAMCACNSCGHEIDVLDDGEEVPRIVPSRRHRRWLLVLLVIGLPALFVFPVGTVLGLACLFAAIFIGSIPDRCGRCGAELQQKQRRHCFACGANLTFDVH